MPIVQVALDVPDDLYKDVLNGSLELLGMVKDGQKGNKAYTKSQIDKIK